jgi:hypothetical protein
LERFDRPHPPFAFYEEKDMHVTPSIYFHFEPNT